MQVTSDKLVAGEEADVLVLLREQAALYARLSRYASRQRALVTEADAGPLLSLLADRQKLARSLTELSARLEPVRRSWSAVRAGLSASGRAEADRLWEDSRRHLREVMDRDEEDARVLSARKATVAGALRGSHDGATAIHAYGGGATGAPAGRLDEAS